MAEELFTPILYDRAVVPEKHRIAQPMEQRHYLCDGAIKEWSGPQQDVLSPLCEAAGSTARQKHIGSYPLLTETQAMESLEAACGAYDHGRGEWPTMPVEERIRHVEAFAYRMQEQREEVVKLLMWEIGKTLPDAEKEFDRTVDYIRDTIDALKDLDRLSSRFVIEQGVIGQIRRAPLGVVLCMGPFNYPLNETFTTLIPALVMGNAVILKPPKLGVLLHQSLLKPFRESFPQGVINTVYGDGQQSVSGKPGNEAVHRGAVRTGRPDCPIQRYRGTHELRDAIRLWTAGQLVRKQPGSDCRSHRPLGQSGLPGQHKQPVPARS